MDRSCVRRTGLPVRAVAVLFASVLLHGQQGIVTMPLQGQIQRDQSPSLTDEITIQLVDQTGRPMEQTTVRDDGEFRFERVPHGDYRLRAIGPTGALLREEFVSWRGQNFPIVFRLKQEKVSQPVSGTISLRRLRHKVPSKAAKELVAAQRAREAGHLQSAVSHLEKAIEADPEYTEAYNNLGARYIELGQSAQAIPFLQRSIELDDLSAFAHSNLALAFLQLGRSSEAEASARRSLALESELPSARYVLGVSLARQAKFGPETTSALQIASRHFANARLALAQVLVQAGRRTEAEKELQQYLGSENADKRAFAEQFLHRLRTEQ